MRRLLLVLLSLPVLVAGLVTLWLARGPLPSVERITGGVLTTQQELAAQQGVDAGLTVMTDEGMTSTTIVGAPEISGAALDDVQALDAAEMAAEPETTNVSPELTTDVVLDENTEVAVAPLAVQAAGAPAGGPDGQGGPTVTATYQQRVVELEWPDEFRVGRGGLVRIKLKVLEGGAIQPVAEVEDNEVIATPILITDRFDTHDGTVTATLAAPDFDVESTSSATQVLTRNGEPEWRWTLESSESGGAIITLGLTISWQPKPGISGSTFSTAIWGQTLNVDINYVFGIITVPQASILGVVLSGLGVIGQVPLLEKFLEIFLDILFSRDRKRDRRDRNRRRR